MIVNDARWPAGFRRRAQLQLQSLNGEFQLFQKSELTSFSRQLRFLMPAGYATTLNGDERNDLITFLMFTARDAKTEAALPRSPRTMKKSENRLSFARTLQGHKSPSRNNVTDPSTCYSFQTHSGF
jgi:hypothetical protein